VFSFFEQTQSLMDPGHGTRSRLCFERDNLAVPTLRLAACTLYETPKSHHHIEVARELQTALKIIEEIHD
jgi:hypothetical protein